jgi:3-deoxy-manno-octulosonate cytidylyltransferase (CMP-KDO synthetase)
MPTAAIIVPCRLESTRFPRKLLHPVRGKPLLLWVAERIRAQAPELPLWFAVDDALLAAPLRAAGFQVLMTDPRHASGTDRLAEANRTVCADRVINVQADEPLVTAAQIRALATLIAGNAPMATLATPFQTAADFLNPNQVKVVFASAGRARPLGAPQPGENQTTIPAGPAVPPYPQTQNGKFGPKIFFGAGAVTGSLTGRALTFSRAPIPFARDRAGQVDDAWVRAHPCYKHLGLYAYHATLLEKFSVLPPGRYEQIEKLEQLRVLENGHDILVGVTDDPSIGVDTPEDAAKFEAWLGRD